MGMDLINNRGNYFGFNWHGWRYCLKLAKAYGWRPAGTLPPLEGYGDSEGWGGGYCSNDTQLVTSEDAHALACALQRALQDPERPQPQAEPEEEALVSEVARAIQDDLEKRPERDPEEEAMLSGPGLQCWTAEIDLDTLRKAIDFFRKGSFRIY